MTAGDPGETWPADQEAAGTTRQARVDGIDIVAFDEAHLDAVLRLCEREGWPSFPADPARALRVLTAPGVTTVVAVDRADAIVGFAELFSDGEIQAYLATMVVDTSQRGKGIGTRLVREALRRAGGERIDLLSESEAIPFYESFPHFDKPGFRLYPFHETDQGKS